MKSILFGQIVLNESYVHFVSHPLASALHFAMNGNPYRKSLTPLYKNFKSKRYANSLRMFV